MRTIATVLILLSSIFTHPPAMAATAPSTLEFEATDSETTTATEEVNREAATPVTLPATIVQTLNLEASNGTCEESWLEYATHIGVVNQELSEGTTLYLIPCAMWAHNLAWVAFVTIVEPKNPEGILTIPIRFVDDSPYEGLVARSIAHNINWDEMSKTLRSRFFTNGKEQCGSAAEYVWNAGQRNLLLKTLIKQDVCDGPPDAWTPVFQSKL